MRFAGFGSVVSVLIFSIATASAQHPSTDFHPSVLHPGTGIPPAGAHGAFGSAVYPGTGAPGAKVPVTRPGGGIVNGSHPLLPPPAHPQHGRAVIVPVPVYYGGAGYYSNNGDVGTYAQQPAPSYDYGIADAAPGQPPVVILNQGVRPDYEGPRDYSQIPYAPRPPDPVATIYLIAMSDHTIIPTIAYWADGDTLSYITTEGSQNRVSLSLIDRDFSKQLNESRNVEFKLPPAK
jgi:hypothetical protein